MVSNCTTSTKGLNSFKSINLKHSELKHFNLKLYKLKDFKKFPLIINAFKLKFSTSNKFNFNQFTVCNFLLNLQYD